MKFSDIAAAAVADIGKLGLSPRRVGLLVGGLLIAIATIALISFVQDPFGLEQARSRRLQTRAATAVDLADLHGLEAKGEAATTVRVEAVQKQIRAVATATATLTNTARNADDAATPIDADRLARLRAHDDSLCRSARLDGCPVAVDDAADGKPGLHALSPAGSRNPG